MKEKILTLLMIINFITIVFIYFYMIVLKDKPVIEYKINFKIEEVKK